MLALLFLHHFTPAYTVHSIMFCVDILLVDLSFLQDHCFHFLLKV